GWARKTAMDAASAEANDQDIILCLDADTLCSYHYLKGITDAFDAAPHAVALSSRYCHPAEKDDRNSLAILRYEVYMRCYVLNLSRINSPYAYTPIGSAMAVTRKAYRSIKGMSPKRAGEDFYFLQKLAKHGEILRYSDGMVNPSNRLSDRVPFGTGAALTKGIHGDWSSYPFFPFEHFNEIEKTFSCFPTLYEANQETPMSSFLERQLNVTDLWAPLRNNSKNEKQFVRFCHERVDALRTFQFLRHRRSSEECESLTDENILGKFLDTFYAQDPDFPANILPIANIFDDKERLESLRDYLFKKEDCIRKSSVGLVNLPRV
ncbi:MAG: glycosyltransferase, partial [Candidatus Lindowbacteria bacterium]|nr:glycosyltransferase [Candidatus Lindowbacteria bacterium]